MSGEFKKAAAAPEGGAVDNLREALIQADLKIRSLPGTDQSDVEFIRAALATREEAPAEAGESNVVERVLADRNRQATLERAGIYPHAQSQSNKDRQQIAVKALERARGDIEGWFECIHSVDRSEPSMIAEFKRDIASIDRALAALRAQTPAREDAQPVAYRMWCQSDQPHKGGWWSLVGKHDGEHAIATGGGKNLQPLYTHPAPDALRVAVEALAQALDAVDEPAPKPLPEQPSRAAEAMAGRADDEARSRWENRVYAAKNDLVFKVRQALAALQAEQDSKS